MDAVFAMGSNGSGQLGIGHKEDVSVPKEVLFLPRPPASPIVKVAAGGNHTLLLTRSGELYWSGDPTSGACGLTSGAAAAPVFREARLIRDAHQTTIGRVDLIAATWEASLIVAKDEHGMSTKLFSCGAGYKGELGSGELIVRTPTATRIADFPPAGTEIVDLAASMGHAVCVTSDGVAYGWGSGRKSQIGEPGAAVHAPRRIDGVGFKVARAVCAKESTCLFGEPQSGDIRVLGSDKWELTSKAPARAPAWADVGAGWGSFYILREDGSLLGWGRDDHGQLPPPKLPPLRAIAVGSEHVVALAADGQVLAWGWGEHGNCGPRVQDNDVKGRWNVIASPRYIPPGCHIDRIGAGCATSWVCITTE